MRVQPPRAGCRAAPPTPSRRRRRTVPGRSLRHRRARRLPSRQWFRPSAAGARTDPTRSTASPRTASVVPRIAEATAAAWPEALVQCSTRRPSKLATSPQAYTPTCAVRPQESVGIPPLSREQARTLGSAPTATSSTSYGIDVPSTSATLSGLHAPDPSPQVQVDAFGPPAVGQQATDLRTGYACEWGRLRPRSSVTAAPSPVAVEATSAPTKPAPITTSRAPGCSDSTQRGRVGQSPQVMDVGVADPRQAARVGTGGHARGASHVKLTAPDQDDTPPQVDVLNGRVEPEVDLALTPRARAGGGTDRASERVPARNSLLSAGRSYGATRSPATTVMGSSQPPARSASAHREPASPAADDHDAVHDTDCLDARPRGWLPSGMSRRRRARLGRRSRRRAALRDPPCPA